MRQRSGRISPIITVVLNNSTMAVETNAMMASHSLYNTRDLGGNYADMGAAMGGYAERIEDPAQIIPAFQRARQVTEQEGKAVLLEFITQAETETLLPQGVFRKDAGFSPVSSELRAFPAGGPFFSVQRISKRS